jgi:non-canonical purine NTP pyrophosphatase (RdgB/HAM1 family)
MMKLTYVTGNKNKFENAQKFFMPYGVELEQASLNIREIQAHDGLEVAKYKAQSAWNMLHEPLFVNDASWSIPSLNGFPGPYMKYVNEWFEPIDFIHLMQDKEDRTIILKDTIVFVDETGSTVFTNEHRGTILTNLTQGDYRHPSDSVISLSKSGASISEEILRGISFIENENKVWEDFASWLNKDHA